ncbi:nuclear architecture related protein [Suhomyces tanzawaensis NRRL Y-17324]|uniref:Cytosolic Fe-S cluster assembly factor NAR1 n=1 Tax=Suhomyces tanzawaensis NRRL Y-17324 TaxID=984487 RepID=A0A1E4SBK7_9ASCO|nr:nuclear architecture related protein [Suhomyces tanzawaensis NRRL Y-17324]ODV76894.1 nuclear architecture related protein [Suhomyces tanzawaensis NRRL Y-17324]
MSAILSADDLNDFISPGVACIKPLVPDVLPQNSELNEHGEVEIQLDSLGNPLEISKIDGKQKTLSPAQISLSDCLACSGCITSAEEILVAQHSHDELIRALTDSRENPDSTKVFVASVSHQSRASIATAFDLSVESVDKLLINLFVHQMGFAYVVGTAVGRKLSLIQEAQNIIHKKETGFQGPLLSSICPGWVLYAEKTHPYVLPRVSTVKSPQQITGCILKSLTAHDLGVRREDVYHLSIMPCFDKKLESARPEQVEGLSPDVDCVLTAKELVGLLEQYPQFQLMPPNTKAILHAGGIREAYAKCAPPSWPLVENSWSNDSGSASGGYGYNYLQMYQKHLMLKDPAVYSSDSFTMQTVGGRNSDIYELRLMHNSTVVASSAIVNGFRNIQNLVRKLKPGAKGPAATKSNPLVARRRARMAQKKDADPASAAGTDESADASKCDYVEIMACPNGCINGGGQINPPPETGEKEWLQSALQNYNSIPLHDINHQDNLIQELLQWSESFCTEFGVPQQRLLTTHFNEVEKPTDQGSILLGAKW